MAEHHILCIPRELIKNGSGDKAFIPLSNKSVSDFIAPENIWLGPRSILEKTEDFRQLIPYIALRYNGKIATYRRTVKGNETRLHGLSSIGFGGHIDLSDVVVHEEGYIDIEQTVYRSGKREIEEEVAFSSIKARKQIGFIVDNSNAVGRVHIGIFEIWDLDSAAIEIKEEKLEFSGFFSTHELKQNIHEMEGWSSIIVASQW